MNISRFLKDQRRKTDDYNSRENEKRKEYSHRPRDEDFEEPSNTIMIRGLPLDITEDDIKASLNELRADYIAVRLIKDRRTNYNKGVAFIEFIAVSDAKELMQYTRGELNISGFYGKLSYGHNVKEEINRYDAEKSTRTIPMTNAYEIEDVMPKLSVTYYRAINKHIWNSGYYKLYFPDQRSLPNRLKRTTRTRATCIVRASGFKPIVLEQITYIGHNTEEVVIHISHKDARLEIINKGNSQRKHKELTEKNAYRISKELIKAADIVIHPISLGLVIVIEIMMPEESCPIVQDDILESYRIRIEKGQSIIFESQKPIVIMASRFATFGPIHLPLQVSILAEDGKVLYNSLVCPRRTVRNYRTEIHGLKEQDLFTGQDENEAFKHILNAIKGKIVLGCGVYDQLIMLNVPLGQLAGVREMTTNKVFGTREENWSVLEILTKYQIMETLPQQAIEEARALLNIYMKVKEEWYDNFIDNVDNDVDENVDKIKQEKEENAEEKTEEEEQKEIWFKMTKRKVGRKEKESEEEEEEDKVMEQEQILIKKDKAVKTIDLTENAETINWNWTDENPWLNVQFDELSEDNENTEGDEDKRWNLLLRKRCKTEYKKMIRVETPSTSVGGKEFIVDNIPKSWEELTFLQQAAWSWEKENERRQRKKIDKSRIIDMQTCIKIAMRKEAKRKKNERKRKLVRDV